MVTSAHIVFHDMIKIDTALSRGVQTISNTTNKANVFDWKVKHIVYKRVKYTIFNIHKNTIYDIQYIWEYNCNKDCKVLEHGQQPIDSTVLKRYHKYNLRKLRTVYFSFEKSTKNLNKKRKRQSSTYSLEWKADEYCYAA